MALVADTVGDAVDAGEESAAELWTDTGGITGGKCGTTGGTAACSAGGTGGGAGCTTNGSLLGNGTNTFDLLVVVLLRVNRSCCT